MVYNHYFARNWVLSHEQTPRPLKDFFNYVGGDPAAGSPTATLLRLLPPCEPQVRHDPMERASPKAHSDGATGGVCKEQGRIHRAMMTRDY
jgi:hypothetical protein